MTEKADPVAPQDIATQDVSALADRLLDAQVEFIVQRLVQPAALTELVEQEVDQFFTGSGTMALEDAMPRELIQAVARKYTVQFPVEGAIPELVGQVAARLYRHEINTETSFEDIVDTRSFDELAVAVAEMPLSRRLLRQALDSPGTVDVVADVVRRAVDARLGSGLGQRLRRRLERRVDALTRRGAAFVLASAREDSDELLLDAAREFWRGHAQESIDGFRGSVDDDDVEDTVVLAFEFWRSLRSSEYFEVLLDAGIDEVFDVYGRTPLADVLEDLGIHRDDLVEEGLRFGPPVLGRLLEAGHLHDSVRRQLAPFYASAAFRRALQP